MRSKCIKFLWVSNLPFVRLTQVFEQLNEMTTQPDLITSSLVENKYITILRKW